MRSETSTMPAEIRTTSSRSTSFPRKVGYLVSLFRQYQIRATSNYGITSVRSCIEEYRALSKKYLGRDLRGCHVVEIGFGARPFRMAALAAIGAEVYGVDLERPLLKLSMARLKEIARTNGAERAVKSFFREICFGRGERKAFEQEFDRSFGSMISMAKLYVANAADPEFWRDVGDHVDLIYSEDVIEHVSSEDIERMCHCISEHVGNGAILLLRPNMYSGIVGGHIPEWYHMNVDRSNKRTRPWGHLSDGDQEPSVFLNKLSFEDYRKIFSKYFDVLDTNRSDFGLGRRFLTPETRRRIPEKWSDEDLLTNNVMFVLRNRGALVDGQCSTCA